MDSLVEHLCTGDHPVEVNLRPLRSAQALRQCIDRAMVHIRFTDTRGGTELGVALDSARTDLSDADFNAACGSVTVVGRLKLNSVDVRCVANIDIASLSGVGRLVRID
jgi:hypothetical protein